MNMSKSKECLLHKDVLALMPMEFKPINVINSIRKLYQSPKGIILFRESRFMNLRMFCGLVLTKTC